VIVKGSSVAQHRRIPPFVPLVTFGKGCLPPPVVSG
jgi:hypothetical protein